MTAVARVGSALDVDAAEVPRVAARRASPRGRDCRSRGGRPDGGAARHPRAPRARRPRPEAAGAAGSSPASPRAVSDGSSASTVPVPTRIASFCGALLVHPLARGGAGDPLARAVGCGDAAVEGRRPLHGDPRASAAHGGEPAVQEGFDLVGQHAGDDLDAGRRAGARRRPPSGGPGRRSRRRRARRRPRASASLHGPVRPWWLHGSRVTTAVRPRGVGDVRERVDLGVGGAGAAVPALGDDRRRRRSAARSRPAGCRR